MKRILAYAVNRSLPTSGLISSLLNGAQMLKGKNGKTIETKINPAFERDFYWINPQSVVIPKGKLK